MPKTFLIALILLLIGSLSQAEVITANIVVKRCEIYRETVERNTKYWDLDPDLVLAVMAQESHCLRTIISMDGHHTIGLMQVAEKPWTASEAELLNANTNIYYGMYILYSAINHPDENPEKSVARGLAAYNCGWTSLNANRCLPIGGWNYAKTVLFFWLPVVRGELTLNAYQDTMGETRQEAPEETTRHAH